MIACHLKLCVLFFCFSQMVLTKQAQLQQEWLRNPDDVWNRTLMCDVYKRSLRSIADCLFEKPEIAKDICLVDNLTCAIAIVVNSVVARITIPNSVVLVSSVTYNAVKLAVQYGCDNVAVLNGGVEIVAVDIPFPILNGNASSDEVNDRIVNSYENTLEEIKARGKTVAFAFLDHISSLPSMLLPVERIISVCRAQGVQEILVDGA